MSESELSTATRAGDLVAIRSLLDAGCDIRYVRPHGYTVMIDAVHGADDQQLIPILRLLIDRGADLDAVSSYGESALSVTSRLGRFDAVGVLLDAGADPIPLAWTPLMRAVALGSVADVRLRIESGDELVARDRWDRTAWLLSLAVGEVAKADVLLAAGATRDDRGRGGKTPLMYPIDNGHVAMLRWLLALACDPNETDEFGSTALIQAASNGDTECVRALLDAGADVHRLCHSESAIRAASNLETARMLVHAGADFNDINGTVRAVLTQLPRAGSVACTPEEYRAARHRVFGTANPQRMNFPFWQAMVAGGATGYRARTQFEPDSVQDAPIWCFDRFGTSITELSDGRIVEIAGEHEDSCDPDFCIYNDVIVHRGDGTFDIYGYPETVFPPTDFHTATRAGDDIYIIGNLGYRGTRRSGVTPVYRLNTDTLAIEPVETTGVAPGWISKHKAKLVGDVIEVSGGKVITSVADRELYQDSIGVYALNLVTWNWSRIEEGGLRSEK